MIKDRATRGHLKIQRPTPEVLVYPTGLIR